MLRERIYFVPIYWCVGILSGVVITTCLSLEIICIACCVIALCALVLCLAFDRVVIVVCAFAVLSGMAWSLLRTHALMHVPTRITSGVVTQAEYEVGNQRILIVESHQVSVRVTAPAQPRVHMGDRITFECDAQKPLSTTFAFEQYLWSRGVSLVCRVYSIERVKRASGIFAFFLYHADALQERIASTLQEPASSFVLSMVFGNDALIDEQTQDAFRATGLTHVLVVSGMQVLLLLTIIEWMLVRLRCARVPRLCVHIAVSVGYVLMVGGDPSVVRAACIVALSFILRMCGRLRGNALRMLLYVATAMVVIRPYSLLYDVGFELSFLAAFGLLVIAPRLTRACARIPYVRVCADTIALSLSACITTTPLIALRFHMFSFVSVVANTLFGSLFSLFTVLSFFWSALMWSCPALAVLLSPPVRVCAMLLSLSVHFLASIPYASIQWSI